MNTIGTICMGELKIIELRLMWTVHFSVFFTIFNQHCRQKKTVVELHITVRYHGMQLILFLS